MLQGRFPLQWDLCRWLLSGVQCLEFAAGVFYEGKSILKEERGKRGLQPAGASSVGVGSARGRRGIRILVTLDNANGKQRRRCWARRGPGPQTNGELTEMLWAAAGEADGGTG